MSVGAGRNGLARQGIAVPMIASKPKEHTPADAAVPASLPASEPVRPFARDDFDRDVWSVLGLPVDIATPPEAVQAIERAARDRAPLSFVTPNVNFLVRAIKDPEARRQIIDADLSLIDGAPLVAIGRLLGAPIQERCAGSDVFDALRRRPGFPGRRFRVFFFGGRDGSGEAAAAAIDAEKRGVESAGYFNPGAGDVASMSADEIIDRINAAGADFVLVALGAAKGQAWIDRNRRRLTAPVVAHLGAVIDFAGGAIARAPLWVRRAGLEWAWRIKEEPSLWRRYWSDGLSLAAIVAQRLAPALLAQGRAIGTKAAVTANKKGANLALECSGDLVAGGLGEVRRAFRAAAQGGGDVVLDLGKAGRIDPAFLGLVLMLEKNLRARGAAIAIANASTDQRRLLAAHAIDFPFISAAMDDEIASGGGIAAAV